MNRHGTLLFPFAFFFLFLLCTHGSAANRGIRIPDKKGEPFYLYKDYHALVIGVGDYTNGWPDLPGAEKDAKEVAAALEDFGFNVNTLMNPDSRQLKTALRETAFRTGKEDNRAILLYFAGHGETLALADGTKLGYLIPTDCPLKGKDPVGFDDRAVSMKEIEALALKVRSKHLLMVFDSCFSGSLFNLVRAAPVEISEKSAKPVRQFITAGGAGEQVPDQSVFKTVFLDGIRGDADMNGDGYVTGSELGMALQGKVINYTRGGQHPQYGKINNPKLDKGDFIFVSRNILAEESRAFDEEQKNRAEAAALADERRRLEEERRKTEALLEAQKSRAQVTALADERRRLEEERRKTEALLTELKQERDKKEKIHNDLKTPVAVPHELPHKAKQKKEQNVAQRLAYAPKDPPKSTARRITLRSTPKILSELELNSMLKKNSFFAMSRNPTGNFQNDFIDNKDGTITDRATGLMWETKGSSRKIQYPNAKKYAKKRNRENFAGHSDWRIPTLEEICSLLEPEKNTRGQHINPLFESRKGEYWSADYSKKGPSMSDKHTVAFNVGDLKESRSFTEWDYNYPYEDCYIRAVRTIK